MSLPTRTYLMTREEQRNFDPARFTANLKAAGFVFDHEVCPIKLKRPFDQIAAADDAIQWRQWDVS
jgi:hypothetical protein